MPAGILEVDRGYVWGTTWHGLPNYIQLATPVTIDQARKIMDYPLAKKQLYAQLRGGLEAVDAFAVVRTDHNTVVCPAVGRKFRVMNNVHILDFINDHVIKSYPALQIESVGTLWGGAVAFLSLKANSFMVKGDESETINRLMYYNPIGRGSYAAGAHSTRIVCNNTLRIAAAQSAANETLMTFKHTGNVEGKIVKHLVNLSKFFLELQTREQLLNDLALKPVNSDFVTEFIGKLFPVAKQTDRSLTMAKNRSAGIIEIFETDTTIKAPANRSRYAVLQAVTNWVDHKMIARGTDDAANMWDGLVGNRADIKDRALELLSV